ncbi:MAG: hypothetical protein LBR08_05490 [Bacteroidales bacterium]|nr:hypothetical protein [Bacteroidales bacterium]
MANCKNRRCAAGGVSRHRSGFEYDGVRKHRGIAWFPLLDEGGKIKWMRNRHYAPSSLTIRPTRAYPEFNIRKGVPVYTQFEEDNEHFLFVTRPDLFVDTWKTFFD